MARVTCSDIQALKKAGKKAVMMTAYDYSMAKILDAAGVDCLLVGDSAARAIFGYEQNAAISMDEMILLARAVVRGSERALVTADMPFMSFQVNREEAIRNAGRLVREAGAHAVKVEGNEEVADTVRSIVRAGVPVMGHMGFTPMTTRAIGGHHSEDAVATEERFRQAALALQEAGCFAVLFTRVPREVAAELTRELRVPTFAGADAPDYPCDGLLGNYAVGTHFSMQEVERGSNPYGPTPSRVLFDATQAFVRDVHQI